MKASTRTRLMNPSTPSHLCKECQEPNGWIFMDEKKYRHYCDPCLTKMIESLNRYMDQARKST